MISKQQKAADGNRYQLLFLLSLMPFNSLSYEDI